MNVLSIIGIIFGTGGVATAVVVGIFNRSKTKAEAIKTTTEGGSVFLSGQVEFISGGYQKLIDDVRKQMNDMKTYYDTRINDIQKTMEQHEKEHAEILAQKDEEIGKLKTRVSTLEGILKSNNITF